MSTITPSPHHSLIPPPAEALLLVDVQIGEDFCGWSARFGSGGPVHAPVAQPGLAELEPRRVTRSHVRVHRLGGVALELVEDVCALVDVSLGALLQDKAIHRGVRFATGINVTGTLLTGDVPGE